MALRADWIEFWVMNPINKHIASVVRAARRDLGLTQEAVAESVGRTAESISNIERGDAVPTFETLLKLSELLSVPISSFVPARENQSKSLERTRLEEQAISTIRSLPDPSLRIAIVQIRALDA